MCIYIYIYIRVYIECVYATMPRIGVGAALVALAAGALIIQNKGGGQGAEDPAGCHGVLGGSWVISCNF